MTTNWIPIFSGDVGMKVLNGFAVKKR